MSVIFQDPFMSDDQSFDKLLTGLDYRDANIESSIWQQYLYDFEEDLKLKSAVWQKYVEQSPSDAYRPTSNNFVDDANQNKISNDNQLDAWIEEILNLAPIQPHTSSMHQQTVQNGRAFRSEISKMLETEPSTLTVIDTLVNNASPCSDILDLDMCKSCNFEAATNSPNTLSPKEMTNFPVQRVTSTRANFPVLLPQRLRRLNSSGSYISESSESSHYSSEDEMIQGLSDDEVKTVAPEPKPTPPKPVKKRRRYYKTRKPRLCQYLVELLNNPERNPSMMEWVDREEGIFRFTDSGAVARMWGQRRHKPDMKYENFARSLRTYIAKGVLRKLRSKLVYGFSVPSNWINTTE